MRELFFRGFHPCDGPDTIVVDGEKVKGRWVEGYIVRHPSAIQIGNDYSPWYIHVPPVDPDDNGGAFNVIPSTVGQYTGLKDKFVLRKIFEYDIIDSSSKEILKRKSNFVVERMGTKKWRCSEQKAIKCGCGYAE